MMQRIATLVLSMFLSSMLGAQALTSPPHSAALEARVREVHARVLPSVVALIRGDAASGAAEGDATGVIVHEDGYVLTAAHCLGEVDEEFQVALSDGRVVPALCLGRDAAADYGLMRIKGDGPWPAVPLGESGALKRDQGCLMYGHPDGQKEGRPAVVRLGAFYGIREDGLLQTSCLMMPGDSGGPLFDLEGRVVGINSEIELSLAQNFHVPVDPVKANWKRLVAGEAWNEGGDWDEMPGGEMPQMPQMPPMPALVEPAPPAPQDMESTLLIPGDRQGLAAEIQTGWSGRIDGVVRLRSARGDDCLGVLGIVVDSEGWIVSKSSRVGDHDVRCDLPGRDPCSAKIVARDEARDLVLLRVAERGLLPAPFASVPVTVGSLLTSVGSDGGAKHAGVVGVATRTVLRGVWGFLGVVTELDNSGVVVRSVVPASAAAAAGIQVGDAVQSLDGLAIATREALVGALRQSAPQQVVKLALRRGEESLLVRATLGSSAEMSGGQQFKQHPADYTEVSQRRGGFDAFRHDLPLALWECGGPLCDRDGRVVGMGIARTDRTGGLGLPAAALLEFAAQYTGQK